MYASVLQKVCNEYIMLLFGLLHLLLLRWRVNGTVGCELA